MSDWCQKGSHSEAMEYYYDVAAADADVPELLSSHIRQCPSCRRRIVRLKETIFGAQTRVNERLSPMKRSVLDTLDSHFRCLDERVTCSRARPFLTSLLQPSLKLRIPTPITVHLDQCPQCARDLEDLRKLAVDGADLEKLRWLYGHKPSGGYLVCRRARANIPAFVRGTLLGIDDEILDHLSTCPRCRTEVYARRQALLDATPDVSDDRCEGVAPAGLLDYVIPHGGVIHGSGRLDASHAGRCRKCLEAIQALHRSVYGIMERPESGVATVYSTVEDAEIPAASPGDSYAGYPIRVQVIRRGPQQIAVAAGSSAPDGTARKRVAFNPRVRRMLKTAVAAAAIIPLAALFLYTHGASGITLGEVISAFQQARNVRVLRFDPCIEQVVEEFVISRDLGLLGTMTGDACVIYDLQRNEKEYVNWGSEGGSISVLDDQERAGVEKIAQGCLGFTLAAIPSDARWDRVGDRDGLEVYELTWVDQTLLGRPLGIKFEITIDPSVRLPRSIRAFRMHSSRSVWECDSLNVFEYSTESEM